MKIRNLLLASCVVLAGCGDDDPTGPNTIFASGSLSFSYTGAGATSATTYSASGAATAGLLSGTNGYGTSPWAVGVISSADNAIYATAAVPKTSTTWDVATVTINRTTVGSSPIDPSCSSVSCTDVIISYGLQSNLTTMSFACVLTSGTVTLTSVSSTNAQGTFSGSGTCTAGTGGAPTAFAVTNGTFNVALVPDDI